MTIDYRNAKGWIKNGEVDLLYDLAKSLTPNAVILNIGVEYGKSLACLRAGNPTATIYGMDLDCSKVVSEYGCTLLEVDSHEAVKSWNTPLDLIFVDGDHGENGVLLDAEFARWLNVGCFLLFQDSFDYDNPTIVHLVCPGVNAAVDKWSSREDIKQEFEEILPSVETTRIFKRVRVKEHEQPAGVADSGRSYTDFQPRPIVNRKPQVHERKPQVQRGNQGNRGG